ncbi:MAG: glycosyltransferase family 9 protein [Bacteroidetes bacterium]|nr:glycosyltransferase family 9 protein [Bacteroidota bacterium]
MATFSKENIKKIVVSRTDNLGDVILTLPLITQIKKNFPDASVTFLVKKYVHDLIKDYPGINEFAFIDDLNDSSKLKKFFKQGEFDLLINVYPRFEIALAAFLAGVKIRVGTGYRWYSYLFNKRNHEHRKTAEKHEAVYNLNLLKTITHSKNDFPVEFNFQISEDEIKNLRDKLLKKSFDINSDYIIIHIPSKGSAAKLSKEKFVEYINAFNSEFKNVKVIFTGVSEERDEIVSVIAGISEKDNLVNLCGELTLSELKVLINKSKLFVSNSTGPIHIAGALNKNIIGFYPHHLPASKTRWQPLSKNTVILEPEIEDNMNSIQIESMLKATRNFLK